MKLNYRRNIAQKIFHDDDLTKFLHLSGGYGSGKSFALIQKLFKLSLKNRNLSGGLVCQSYADFKRDIKELMDQICVENKIKYTYHGSEHYYKFPWTTGKLFVTTAEKPIKGPNWAFAGINELTLIPIERYREIIARVRLKKAPCPQVVSCGTPEGLLSGYYDFFIENPKANSKVVYANTRDNLSNLSPDYIDSLKSAYDEQSLKAYLEGEFINRAGNAFYYAYSKDKNEDKTMEENTEYPVLVSMDFNVDPMVATIWQWQLDGSLGAVNELILRQNADTNKMCNALKDQGYTPDRTEIFPDPAGRARSTKGQPDHQILRNNGFTDLRIKNSAPSFRKRQLNTNNLFEKKKLKVNPVKCPWMRKDLMRVTQDKSTLEKEKTNPELTHSSDGLDYMCDILFPFSGTKPHQSGSDTLR